MQNAYKFDAGRHKKTGGTEVTTELSAVVLAARIATDIMDEGNGPTPCKRIQFMGGEYPDREIPQGGFCKDALVRCIQKSLIKHTFQITKNP